MNVPAAAGRARSPRPAKHRQAPLDGSPSPDAACRHRVPDEPVGEPELENELAEEHTRIAGSIDKAVEIGVVDEIVEPSATRSAIAKAIAGAVQRNQSIVPVGIESAVLYRVLPFVPGPVQGLLTRVNL